LASEFILVPNLKAVLFFLKCLDPNEKVKALAAAEEEDLLSI